MPTDLRRKVTISVLEADTFRRVRDQKVSGD